MSTYMIIEMSRVDSGNKGLDIAKCLCERLVPLLISRYLWNVIGHHHAIVTHFLVYSYRRQHIDIAVVNERFSKVKISSANVTKRDVEDFSSAAEVTNHVKAFVPRILQHL